MREKVELNKERVLKNLSFLIEKGKPLGIQLKSLQELFGNIDDNTTPWNFGFEDGDLDDDKQYLGYHIGVRTPLWKAV